MPSHVLHFQGSFALWSYTIGHGRLLLRRTKSTAHPTRVDVLFKDVGWMCLPTTFQGLAIEEVVADQVHEHLPAAGAVRVAGRKVYRLSDANWRGHVVAATVVSNEDDGEYNDPSPLLE